MRRTSGVLQVALASLAPSVRDLITACDTANDVDDNLFVFQTYDRVDYPSGIVRNNERNTFGTNTVSQKKRRKLARRNR